MAERRRYSLAARLALITALWSAMALMVMGVILTDLFRRDSERVVDAKIEADLVNLVRDASRRPGGEVVLPGEPLGPLFREPFSGWAWQVRQGDRIVAQSGSLGPRMPGVMEPLMAPGTNPADFVAPGGIPSRGAAWQIYLTNETQPLTFAVARPRSEIDEGVSFFSRLLAYSLGIFGAVMFVASLIVARMVLAPVTQLKDAVRRLRDGETGLLDQAWPREVEPVVDELEDLSAHIGRMIERSRNQTSDLAHALKTPLTILQQGIEQLPRDQAAPLTDQVERIERSLDWHLTRRLAGPHRTRVAVRPVAEDVLFAMSRLFQGRQLGLSSRVEPGACFIGDEEDLHEMLGNLIENACKWAASKVAVTAGLDANELTIRIEDDGPGIPAAVAETVFQRGARLDESVPGHGHGLAIVRDIARLYGGSAAVGRSAAGGAEVILTLPGERASVPAPAGRRAR